MQKGKQSASMPLQISTDPRKKIEENIPGTTDPPKYKLEKSILSKKIESDESAVITHQFLPPESSSPLKARFSKDGEETAEEGRERPKRHRVEVSGRVWIPDMWGQEDLLKDWTDCTAFDSSLVNSSIMSARAALIEESRRTNSTRMRIENQG